MTPVESSWPLTWWGYQDLNLGPLPYQFGAAAWWEAATMLGAAVAVSRGESLRGVVAVTSAVTGLDGSWTERPGDL